MTEDAKPKKTRKTDKVMLAMGRCWRHMEEFTPSEKVAVARFLLDRAMGDLQSEPQRRLGQPPGPDRPGGGTLFD